MSDLKFRALTDNERDILEKLLSHDFQGRDALAEQLKHSFVRKIDENGSLEFNVQTDVKADVKKRIPIEGQYRDIDGMQIHVLLHVVDQKLKELEIYKDDSSLVKRMPTAHDLELVQLP